MYDFSDVFRVEYTHKDIKFNCVYLATTKSFPEKPDVCMAIEMKIAQPEEYRAEEHGAYTLTEISKMGMLVWDNDM